MKCGLDKCAAVMLNKGIPICTDDSDFTYQDQRLLKSLINIRELRNSQV